MIILLSVTGLVMGQAMVQHAAAAAGGAVAAASSKKVAEGLDKILGSAATSAAAAAGPPAPTVKQAGTVPPAASTTARRAKHSPFEPQVNRTGGSEMTPVVVGHRSGIPSPSDVEFSGAPSGEAAAANSWVSRRSHPLPQAGAPAITPFVSNDILPVTSRGNRRTIVGEPEVTLTTAITPPPPTSANTLTKLAIFSTPVVPPPPPPIVATAENFAAIQPGASYESILTSLGTPASKIEMIEDGQVLESLRIESHGSKLGTIRLVNGVVKSIEPAAR